MRDDAPDETAGQPPENEGAPPSPTEPNPPEADETANEETEPQPQAPGSPTGEDLGTDKGYIGTKVDPLPNEAHSLESGPDAPSAAEQDAALRAARVEGDQPAETSPDDD